MHHPDYIKIQAASALITRAKQLVRSGDQISAYHLLSEAMRTLQDIPQQSQYYQYLSQIYDEMGMGFYVCNNRDLSIEMFKKAISIDPNNLQARSHLRVASTSAESAPPQASPPSPQTATQPPLPLQGPGAQPVSPSFPARPQPEGVAPSAPAGAPVDFRKQLLMQGTAFEQMGQIDEAIRCYTELITRAPYNIEGYKRLLKLKPNDVALLEKYASALERVELLEELVEVLHRLIDLDPKIEYIDRLKKVNPYDMKIQEVEKDLAIMHIELQDLAFGMRTRRISASEVESFAENLESGEFDAAMFQRILKSGDYTQEQLFRIADRLFEMKKYNEASQALDKILQDAPDDVTVWLYKGSTLFKTGNYEFALQCFDRATRIQPDNVTAWLNKGIVLYWMERYDDAISALDTTLKYDPDEAGAWYYKACCKASQKDKDGALECLKKAIEKDPAMKRLARSDAAFREIREDKSFSVMIME